jgi:hypothetical protein
MGKSIAEGGMSEEQMIEWLGKATPIQLLEKWRMTPFGTPWFRGAVGKLFSQKFSDARKSMSRDEWVAMSEQVGFENSYPRRAMGPFRAA